VSVHQHRFTWADRGPSIAPRPPHPCLKYPPHSQADICPCPHPRILPPIESAFANFRYALESHRPSETSTLALSGGSCLPPSVVVRGRMVFHGRPVRVSHLRYTDTNDAPRQPPVKVHRVFSSHSDTTVSSRPLQFRQMVTQDSEGVVTPLMRTTIISGQGITLP